MHTIGHLKVYIYITLIHLIWWGIQENGYSFKSDIWSSGCLLYELAALQSPFFSDKLTLFALCEKIEKCDYPSLGPDYSLEFKELVGLMVIGDMKKRIDADRVYEVAKKMYENSTRLNREASKADDKR